MPNTNKLIDEQDFLKDFNTFMSTYQQLAAIKMQQVRGSILQTRRYMDGLADVFTDVQQAHARQIKALTKASKGKGEVVQITFSSIKKNGKEAMILITPDTKFSGAINRQVFEAFAASFEVGKADVFTIGSVGEQLFKSRFSEAKETVFHIPQTLISPSDLKEILEGVIHYERVDVFYPRFFTLVNQNVSVSNITGNISLEQRTQKNDEQNEFIFEPELKDMLRFFEIQIFASLLQQTVNESYLANLGSRIVTLESATQNVQNEQEVVARNLNRIKKAENNRKQRGQIAGMQLW